MNTSLGDLAQSFMLQRRGAALKTDMSRLTQEISTGRVADPKSVLGGNFSYFTEIERDIRALQGFKVSTAEAGQFVGAMQNVMDRVQSTSSDLANSMLLISNSSTPEMMSQATSGARADLSSLVSTINGGVAGRTLFAGAATDTAPLASDAEIINGLKSAISGHSGAGAVMAAAQSWFDDPAGFRAAIYRGSDDALSPYALSDTDRLTLNIRADDPVFRDLIMNTALAAIADDASLALSDGVQRDIIAQAAENLLGAQDGVTRLRANIGFAEARIENVTARNAAEDVSLQIARSELLSVDPYETATKLEDVQFQLQSLYSVTVRLSELSLLNFMR